MIPQSSLPSLPSESYLSWAEIDLAAIRHNYRIFRQHIDPATKVFAVIKADAYGHGAVETARALLNENAPQFCVARVEEAVQLRDAGIDVPILVLAPAFRPQALIAAKYACSVVVCDASHITAVAEAQTRTGIKVPVHLKLDVGMNRLGTIPVNASALVDLCIKLGVLIEGIMAHLPCADAESFETTEPMIDLFLQAKQELHTKLDNGTIFHICNSAAALRSPRAWLDAVRIGISLYGQYPSVEMERNIDLKPAMTLKTRITYLKDVPSNTPVSYSHTYKTSGPARLATVPLGYADGWPRHASGRADFIINGQLAPQVGRVCMDQVVLDVTGIPNVNLGDEAIAFGNGQGTTLRAEDVSARFDSIGYELTTRLGKRVPRLFM